MTTPTDDLQQRCTEVLEWQKTGELRDGALRQYAAKHWHGQHDSLQMAERSTAEQAMAAIAKWGQPQSAPVREPQPMPDLTQLTERGAEAWAGVDAQVLRAGVAPVAANAGSEPVALDHIACIEDGELRYMTGRKAPSYDCELYAMPGGKSAPPLYTHPSPPEGMVGGWQDIATAPKDGTSIIAYRPSSPPHIECMNWCAYEDADIPGAWHWAYDGDAPRENPPTHWIPIPPPPTTSAGSGKGE